MRTLRFALLTAFGLGYLRPAPGTWGSTPPVAMVLLLLWFAREPSWMIDISLALLGLAFSIACVRFGEEMESHLGRKDPGHVVADEVAGQCIALLLLPWRAPIDLASWRWNLLLAGTAFVAFRLCDIIKPPPARNLQRLRGGWGILIDDLLAGAYAAIVTQLAVRLVLPSM